MKHADTVQTIQITIYCERMMMVQFVLFAAISLRCSVRSRCQASPYSRASQTDLGTVYTCPRTLCIRLNQVIIKTLKSKRTNLLASISRASQVSGTGFFFYLFFEIVDTFADHARS